MEDITGFWMQIQKQFLILLDIFILSFLANSRACGESMTVVSAFFSELTGSHYVDCAVEVYIPYPP